MSRTPRRRPRNPGRKYFVAAGAVASILVTAGAWAVFPGLAGAATLETTYAKVSDWGTGYTAQYTIANTSGSAVSNWSLAFDLPTGQSVSSLWNAVYTASGQHVAVTPANWDATIAAGSSVTVGFVVKETSGGGDPTGCTINGSGCKAGSTTSPTPTTTRTTASPTPTASPTKTATASPTATPTSAAGSAAFSPYVDTTLFPAFNLSTARSESGVTSFNLAFVVSNGTCTPSWGGVDTLSGNAVASQISAFKAAGGDVRISFGGASGTELAQSCTSVGTLQAAYQKVIDTLGVKKLDFDVEGAAVADTASIARRNQALAALENANSGLQVSYTLPVLPTGLTGDGVAVLTSAKSNGVTVDAVNIMAMDYGDGAAPNPSGKMATFAEQAATATQSQVKSAFGLSDSAAWAKVAVTPMIGVNDTSDEIFTVSDASTLAAFASSKGLAWTSMWSAGRDKECSGGAKSFADATCSSIVQSAWAFSKAFNG
jgi:hypothetical protein